jgi:AcrR family transcriptional regulator
MTDSHDQQKFAPTAEAARDDTRERLLDAAEVLFCRQGFDRTSVRDLTAAAGCNVAAVNYHFGGKQQLYLEMFRRRLSAVIQECIDTIDTLMAGPNPNLEDLIRCWVTPPLKALETQEPRAMIMRLMVREFLNKQIDPVPIVRDLKPLFIDRLSVVLRELVPDLPEPSSLLSVLSIEAILLHPLLFIEYYLQMNVASSIDDVIEHVVAFGAAAIRGLAENLK